MTPPGASRLSPVDHPSVYLNHFQGIRVAPDQSMKVHMWQWEQPNQFCLAWYFRPADGGFLPFSSAADTKAGDARLKELEDGKKASDAMLKDLQDSKKAYEAKLAELEDGKTGAAATIKELQDKVARQDRELEEVRAAKSAKDAKKKKKESKKDTEAKPQKETNSQDTGTQKKEQKKDQKEEQKEAKKKPQKLQLATRLPHSPPPSPPHEKVSLPATSAVAKDDKAQGCAHVVLPPPRKIRRKVVGIVYAH